MNRELTSFLKPHIESLIAEKNALGYLYKTAYAALVRFDKFCFQFYPTETKLTQEIVMAWATKTETEGQSSLLNRTYPVRELGKHMVRNGVDAYVLPAGITPQPQRSMPHIYTAQELAAFFRGADQFEDCIQNPLRPFTIPTLFRVLYTCGLRPIEALNIRKNDVNLETGEIRILESKGHKDRIVVLSNDMLKLCRKYSEKALLFYPNNEFFFPNGEKERYHKSWLEYRFWDCWKLAGVSEFSGPRPRTYDFRHTFATSCMFRWIQEGKNLDAWLPYLSAYMGHRHFYDTAYYIHLVPSFFPMMTTRNHEKFNSLVPEVCYEIYG